MKVAVIGSGLAGATAARLLHDAGHTVEVFEARSHIGGNCYDEWQNGILVHRYGPHGFHTSKREVWEFLQRFSDFHPTALKVVARTRLGIIPIPFNDVSARIVGDLSLEEIRDLVFRDYSEKQWGVLWERVPASITSRLPERRKSSDMRYHLDTWQGSPRLGYTALFEQMLVGIQVFLGCGEKDWRRFQWDHIIYTGSIDEYYENCFGSLGYRSLGFRYEEEPKREFFQINECNRENSWTRSVDHSHWLDQSVKDTIVAYEYPCEWQAGLVRMYPKPFGDDRELYRRYSVLAAREKSVTFAGRLATYKYLDMDDAIAQTMHKLSGLVGGSRR